MAIADKTNLLKEIEKSFSDAMTASVMSEALSRISRTLERYDVSRKVSFDESQQDEKYLDAFIGAKSLEGRSEKTIERYTYIIGRLLHECKVPIPEMTVFHLRQYLGQERKRGVSESTLEGYRCIYSSFFGWLHKEKLIPENPCANFGAIKCAKKVRTPFTEVEIAMLKEACKTPRDKALISFLLSTGCRIGEVCSLNISDIDFHAGECIVLGKGNKERTVFIDDITLMLLKRYLAERASGGG